MSITISGLLMLVTGGLLYLVRDQLAGGFIRFFLPIPPIGVAAYIFVFNMFKHYQGSLAERSTLIAEMLMATLASGVIFFTFTALMILTISIMK